MATIKSILTFFIVLTVPFFASAQQQFHQGWRMNCEENRNNLEQTSDGGYIISGTIQVPANLIPQCYLMKVDSTGHQQWMRQFPVGVYAYSESKNASVCQTPDGGFALATSFTGGYQSTAYRHLYIVKTDGAGNLLWARTYSAADYSSSRCIRATSDGGLIVAGTTIDTLADLQYAYLLRTDSNGNVLWSKGYWPQNEDVNVSGYTNAQFYSVSQTSDGGFIASGTMVADSTKGSVVVKTDANGNVTWAQGVLNPVLEWTYDFDVEELPDGSFIVCGEDYTVQYYSTLTHFSASGVPLWRKTYGATTDTPFWSHLVANSVAADSSGFTFSLAEWVSPGDRTRLVHTDTAGNPQWMRRYTMTMASVADVESTTGGGYAFTAYTPDQYNNYLMLYKTDHLGVAPCDDYAMPDTVVNLSLPVSRPLSVMNISGSSAPFATTLLNVTLADSNLCANVIPHGIEETVSLYAPVIYPNPAREEVFVALSNLQGNTVVLQLFDALGQQVAATSSANNYGQWQNRFETATLSEGVYMVTVEIDGVRVSTQKVVILE